MGIATIEEFINKSEQMDNDGESFLQQTFVNYIEEELGLNVIEVKKQSVEDLDKEEFKITAESNRKDEDSKYEFLGEHDSYSNHILPQDNLLTLKRIYGEEGEHELTEEFSMVESNEKGIRIIETPLRELIDKYSAGFAGNEDLQYAINILKKTLKDKPGYDYYERDETFIITIQSRSGDKIIQIEGEPSKEIIANFRRIGFRNMELTIPYTSINKYSLQGDIHELNDFIERYMEDGVTLDNRYDISELAEELEPDIGLVNVNPVIKGNNMVLMNNLDRDFKIDVVDGFQLGGWDTYKRIEVNFKYDFPTKELLIEAEYLFKKVELRCDSVEAVVESIRKLKSLIEEDSQKK